MSNRSIAANKLDAMANGMKNRAVFKVYPQ
jgi:hypothetical protein